MNSANQTYSEIEISTEIMTASAHRLVQLMLDKCLLNLEMTKIHIERKDIPKKHQCITRAMDIVEYLRICLNHQDERTKEMASHLDALYIYAQQNIIQANMTNEIQYLDHAKHVLADIKSGWDGIN